MSFYKNKQYMLLRITIAPGITVLYKATSLNYNFTLTAKVLKVNGLKTSLEYQSWSHPLMLFPLLFSSSTKPPYQTYQTVHHWQLGKSAKTITIG